MKQIPMMLQLTVILFCIMAIPTAILTSYSGTQILSYSEKEIAESSLAGLHASRNLMDNALNNLEVDAVRLAASNIFDRVRYLETYDEVNAGYANVIGALSVLRELVNLNHRADGVYSSYFYLDGSNYVISTDKGITPLERYEPIDWMEDAYAERKGISGVWIPRKLSSGVDVLSYMLPLSPLTTTTRGTIVVNLQETQISRYLRSSDPGEQEYVLLNSSGEILSHKDKSLLFESGLDLPFVQEMMMSPRRSGYAFHEVGGDRLLYAWARSEMYDWLNVKRYSMDELMTQTNAVQRNIILITVVVILIGAVVTVFLATWLSRPVRNLVRTVRSHANLRISNKKNELAFLDEAFKRMQEEKDGLRRLLRKHGQDTRKLAVHRLLRGESAEPITSIFAERYYTVAYVSIDRYRHYVSNHNPETRSYHRYMFIQKCEGVFPASMQAQAVYENEGGFAIVINYGEANFANASAHIREALAKIRDEAAPIFGHTVTIGVSRYTEQSSLLPDRMAEAVELIKQRLINGGGTINFWREESEGSHKYLYPANSERRILNYLDTGDLASILKELDIISEKIRSADYISCDNILFIYNQLAGVTIRHLRENANTARVFKGNGHIYSILAGCDTLDEIEEYFHDFYEEIVRSLEGGAHKTNHAERIKQYLEAHYNRDFAFEEMAKEIGISYSYMRKIVSEQLGRSLIDCLNQLRIEKAKELLPEAELTIAHIAETVGYHNVQSFNRYFRKYEGMSPGHYRSLRTKAR